MKNTMINQEHIEGKLYDHSLELKTVQNKDSANFGKPFISGELSVAVDDEGLNIIDVHFTYVGSTLKNDRVNPTFSILNKIIEEGKKWIAVGPDEATMVSINTAIGLREFFDDKNQLVSMPRNEGGFVNIVSTLGPKETRNTFTADMVITKTRLVEPDEERGIENEYLILHGAVFNFRKDLLPIEVVVRDPNGIRYFESFDYKEEPLFTKVTGRINNITTQMKKEEETAFSGVIVKYVTRNIREWEVVYTQKEPYLFGDSNTITAEELKVAMQNREVMLAEELRRQTEFRANRNNSIPSLPPTATSIPGMNIPISANANYDF